MTMTLKRSTVYTSPFPRYACSRPGCTGNATFGNAAGTRWCVDHHTSYRLVEHMSDVLSRHTTGAGIARSPLGDWLTFARCGSDEDIEQACKAMEVS